MFRIQAPQYLTTKTAKVRSEIQTSQDFEWSKRGWVANGQDF